MNHSDDRVPNPAAPRDWQPNRADDARPQQAGPQSFAGASHADARRFAPPQAQTQPVQPGQPAPHAPYVRPAAASAPTWGTPLASAPASAASATHATASTRTLSAEPGATSARPRRRGAAVWTTALVAASLLGGAAGFGGAHLAGLVAQPAGSTIAQQQPAVEPVANPSTIAQVAAAAGPSVVTVQASSGSAGGEGSGVVVAAGGYIVTNNHVVTLDGQAADASVTVRTSDGRLLAATIVGTDPLVDLAVLKVDADLPVVTFAASDDVRVGDSAIAIGAPLGLSNSVTDGIVSAVDRGLRIASSAAPSPDEPDSEQSPFGFWQQEGAQAAAQDISIPVVQTDASINPGNSGGALLDASGRLIGVNVAIASLGQGGGEQSGSIGIGFAIEASLVQRVVSEIIETGSATHGLLGATVTDVRDASVGTVGAQIRDVSEGGAAASAGLRAGDVITRVGTATVTGAVDATAQVRYHPAGAQVEIRYVRDGREQTATVTLGALE